MDYWEKIENLLGMVENQEDKVLVKESTGCYRAGSLRAAFVMLWIAIAESLKRRFRVMANRDSSIEKVVGRINDKEEKHLSVDGFLLDKALTFGLISDLEKEKFGQMYTLRCVYAHPYELEPNSEEYLAALAFAIQGLLSRPVFLRHSYVEKTLATLAQNVTFLDDIELSCSNYADDVLSRVDPSLFAWLVEKSLPIIEEKLLDPENGVFSRRLIWFIRQFLRRDLKVLSDIDWHNFSCEFPLAVTSLLCEPALWKEVSENARDAVVGIVISRLSQEESKPIPYLSSLMDLLEERLLSDRQQMRVESAVKKLTFDQLRMYDLPLCLSINKVIEGFKAHNWYRQKDASIYLRNIGIETIIKDLEDDTLEILGRNILQSAEGNSYDSKYLLEIILKSTDLVINSGLLRGIIYECFLDERGLFRLKEDSFGMVLEALILSNQVETAEAIITSLSNHLEVADLKLAKYIASSSLDRHLDLLTETITRLRTFVETKPDLLEKFSEAIEKRKAHWKAQIQEEHSFPDFEVKGFC